MRNVLRRLWPRQNADPIALDLAGSDWTPPPPSEVGACDWAHWLSEEPPLRRAGTPTPDAVVVPLMLSLPSSQVDGDDIVGTWAEPEELEEIEEEPIVGEPVPIAAEPPTATPVETVAAALPPRRRRDTLGGGRARIRTPMPERRWRDVLSGYAEHLTDEELAIIRKQMAK